ncbi:hypothetical protein [Spirochaeta cellobiosiphila]|uniref:hypothetical protein n=1 Tax=Spirochaeta cellobiosiphila TaxID=504483 RepID=UPI0003F61483|nr:hypothetical protein [Spirochaeta cellobiosiphila]
MEKVKIKSRYSILFLFIYLVMAPSLSADNFKVFQKLEPEVDNMELELNPERTLFFYDLSGSNRQKENILQVTLPTMEESLAHTDSKLNPAEVLYGFYNPNTNESYCYLMPVDTSDYPQGWYKLHYVNEVLSFVKNKAMLKYFHRYRSQTIFSIPGTNDLLSSQYEININGDKLKHESIRIISQVGQKVIWSLSPDPKELKEYHNALWIKDTWLLIEDLGIIKTDETYVDTLVNYKNGQVKSFAPDIIIGNGNKNIITTSKDLMGINVQDPYGNIEYKDSNLDLIQPIRDKFGYDGFLYFAYYDPPYLYYEVYDGFGFYAPIFSVIIDLINKKSYYNMGSRYSSILGVF